MLNQKLKSEPSLEFSSVRPTIFSYLGLFLTVYNLLAAVPGASVNSSFSVELFRNHEFCFQR